MKFTSTALHVTIVIIVVAASCGDTLADDPSPKAVGEYARAIAAAQADLDGGRIMEARQKLESTDKSQRSFEYDYLDARTRGAPAKGPAPDLIETVEAPKVEFRYAVLNEASSQVAFICRDGAVRVYDLSAPAAAPKVVTHEGSGALWSGAFSSDGSAFVAGNEKSQVMVWETATWKLRATVSVGKGQPVRELAVAPNGSAFAAEGESAIELWSLTNAEPRKVAEIGQRYNFGEGLAFSPKGDLIATGGMFDIDLFNASTGEKTQTLKHASYTMGLTFSPDGSRIASAPSGNVNKLLAVFQVAHGKMLFNAGPFPCYVHGGVFTPDGKRIISTACEKVPSLQMYDSATGELVFALARPQSGSKPVVSRDGQRLGWSERDGYRFIYLGKKRPADK